MEFFWLEKCQSISHSRKCSFHSKCLNFQQNIDFFVQQKRCVIQLHLEQCISQVMKFDGDFGFNYSTEIVYHSRKCRFHSKWLQSAHKIYFGTSEVCNLIISWICSFCNSHKIAETEDLKSSIKLNKRQV